MSRVFSVIIIIAAILLPLEVCAQTAHHYMYAFPPGHVDVFDMDNNFVQVKNITLSNTANVGNANVRGAVASPSTGFMYISYDPTSICCGNGHLIKYNLMNDTVVWDVSYSAQNIGTDSMSISPDGSTIYMPDGESVSDGLWYVISAVDGSILRTINSGGSGPHNTQLNAAGTHVYMGPRHSSFLVEANAQTGAIIQNIGPIFASAAGGVRPFTIDPTETYAFMTPSNNVGFTVASVSTGAVLYSLVVPPGFQFTGTVGGISGVAHGIEINKAATKLWLIDLPAKHVHVFDITPLPSNPPVDIADIALTCNIPDEGWLERSVDDQWIIVGDCGNVISTSSNMIVATMAPMINTRIFQEVDFSGGTDTTTPATGTPTTTPGSRNNNNSLGNPCSVYGTVQYCGSLSLANVQVTAPPFTGSGGQGQALTLTNDLAPSELWIRATDQTFCGSGGYAVGGGGSADAQSWNSDSTKFMTDSGLVLSFNPQTLAVGNPYNCATTGSLNGGAGNVGTWARDNNHTYYYLPKNATIVEKLDFSSTTPPTFPVPQQVVNFTSGGNCLPLNYGFTSSNWEDFGGVDATGTIFTAAFSNTGGQGSGVDVVAFKSGAGGGCIHLNTNTGVITGDWGATGTWTLGHSLTIHNVKMSKDGSWLVIATSSCTGCAGAGVVFWNIGTLTAINDSNFTDTHWTTGNSIWGNVSECSLPAMQGQLCLRPMGGPANQSPTAVVSTFPPGFTSSGHDNHPSWFNVDIAESTPVFTEGFCSNTGAGTCTSLPTAYTSAWVAEVSAWEHTSPYFGSVRRFGHSFNSSTNNSFCAPFTVPPGFATCEGIGEISQDGQWFAVGSDMMQQTAGQGNVYFLRVGTPTGGGGGSPAVSITPNPVAFGNVPTGTSSSNMTATVSNTGTLPLTLFTPYFTITGTNAADFSNIGTGTCANGGVVNAGTSCTVILGFTPSTSGSESATLNISGNASGSVSLTGTGTAPIVSFNPTALIFGAQPINILSGILTTTLTNTGTANLAISSVTISAQNIFALTSPPAGQDCRTVSTVIPGGTCLIAATFDPNATTPFSATVTVADNAPGSPQTISLSGTGFGTTAPSPVSLVQLQIN